MKRAKRITGMFLVALGAPGSFGSFCAALPASQEEVLRSQPFALPLARDARTIAERARGHLDAQRWSEAIADLQRLLEEHGADVLPPEWRASSGEPSVYVSHPGAGAWARRTLSELPPVARRLYRERYEPQAALALARAREEDAHLRRPLVEVARRFPLTVSAASAWWSLADVELERGHLGDALLAYERAASVLAEARGVVPSALERRIDSVRAWGGPSDEARSRLEENESIFAASSGPVPRGDADRWPESFELDADPLTEDNVIDTYRQFPVLAQDRVVVNTAYHLYAVDAYTGALLWKAGPPSGWASLAKHQRKDLAAAIAHDDLLLAPAAAGNVIVGAMQIPYSINPSDRWQGIEIMEAIPERRLYAFDAQTGRELWNHEPPLYWDPTQSRYAWNEELGTYAQRMLVAAPPVVNGARILVPCYRMSGRIEYHLACYEAETGERLWSTPLVSGQRETNMFGRAGKEFVASPVAVAGGRVIVQTELGTVAALDLLTGEILWESLYEQIPLPKTISYQPPERSPTWRLAPPAIAGPLAICTPHDSHHLVAFLLEDGRVPWSVNQRKHLPRLRSGGDLQLNLLLGAEGDVVYMAGESVVALEKPGGLTSPGSGFMLRWSYPLENERVFATPRPVLTRDAIVVPLRDGRVVLDRDSGSPLRLKSASWAYQEYGNVLVGDGTLYTLNRGYLSGFFDWDALLERARLRLRENADDPLVVSEVAELFLRRGIALHDQGEAGRALSAFEEARRLLEPQRSDGGDPDVDARLFRVLRSEAAVQADLGSADQALVALDRARALAPDETALADVLFQEERLLRGRDVERRLAVLSELERSCAALPLPPAALVEGPGWLIGESLRDPQELSGWEQVELPVGLWVLLTRAETRARLFEKEQALEDLHAALARYGELFVTSELRVGDLVSDRIARRINMDGRGVYAAFEKRASELYGRAVEEHDERLLTALVRLYPHSEAAAAAQRTRLAWAYATGDTQTVVELAYATLSSGPLSAEDALALLRAANVLGRAGNVALQGLILDSLAGRHPELRSDLPEHEGRTIAELAAALSASSDGWREPPTSFDSSVRPAGSISGAHSFAGTLRVPPGLEHPEGDLAHVYLRRSSLRAFSASNPSEYLWPPFELPFAESMASLDLSATRIVAGGRQTLLAVDVEGGQAWRHEIEERISHVSVHRGMALVLAGPRTSPDRLYAYDSEGGLALWEVALPDPGDGTWQPAVFGGGRAALFLQRTSQPASVLVVDLVRGRIERMFDVEVSVGTEIEQYAWIAGDTLYIPSFRRRNREDSTLHAYGLDTGSSLWSVPLPKGETLSATISCQGREYLVTLGLALEGGQSGGGVYLLEDPLNGLFRQVVRFRPGEDPMGLGPNRRRVELEEPILFLESLTLGASTTPIRAVNLPYGNGWTHTLPVSQEDLAQSGMPLPAVSEDCVAIAYVRLSKSQQGLKDGVRLVFLDKTSGILLDRRDLDLPNVSTVELHGLGPALFVVATGRGASANRIDILETQR